MRSITGGMINYYFICKRKLWLFANYVELENESADVAIGKMIDESRFTQEKHHVLIADVMNADFIKNGHIVHEVKKAGSSQEAGEWQVKFYLRHLEELGIEDPIGVLHYDKEHKTQEIYLTEDDRERLELIINEMQEIITSPTPPSATQRAICKKCAYYEFCFI